MGGQWPPSPPENIFSGFFQEGFDFFCEEGILKKPASQKKNRIAPPPPTMSSVRTERQKKDATTPVEPPPAPVIATPYNMEKEAAP